MAIDERLQDVTAAAEASALRLARLNERAVDGIIWFASAQHARCLRALRELGDVDLSSLPVGARQLIDFLNSAIVQHDDSANVIGAPGFAKSFDRGNAMALRKPSIPPLGDDAQLFWLTAATQSLAMIHECCALTLEPLLADRVTAANDFARASFQGPPRPARPPVAAAGRSESVPPGTTLWEIPLAFEKIWADSINDGLEFWRDLHQALAEFTLSSTLGTAPIGAGDIDGGTRHRIVPDPGQGGSLPPPVSALGQADRSEVVETIIRMLLLVCRAAQPSPDECFQKMCGYLETMQPFNSCAPQHLSGLINRQAFIIDREPERARAALPDLLQHSSDRRLALEVVTRLTALTGADAQAAVVQTCRELRMLLPVGSKTGVTLTTVPLPRRQSPEGMRPQE
jgi:hypothetical protein